MQVGDRHRQLHRAGLEQLIQPSEILQRLLLNRGKCHVLPHGHDVNQRILDARVVQTDAARLVAGLLRVDLRLDDLVVLDLALEMRDALVLVGHHLGHLLLDVDLQPEVIALAPRVQQLAQPVARLLQIVKYLVGVALDIVVLTDAVIETRQLFAIILHVNVVEFDRLLLWASRHGVLSFFLDL